jgi:protein SCO1/2
MAASGEPIDRDVAFALSQGALGRVTGDEVFTDQNGTSLRLTQLRGHPVIVNFVYTSCAFICPTLTSHLAAGVRAARETLGRDAFAVVTIGFDTQTDTPEHMRRFASERGISLPGWYFVSADEFAVKQLARDTGFSYQRAAGAFDHIAQVTILDRDGRVYRQIYGDDFEPPLIVDPLKRLALGAPALDRSFTGLLEKIRLLCTSYDPKNGRYRFDYSLILEIAIGLSCSVGLAAFILRSWRHGRGGAAPPL